jgi:hypothetical protein
MSIQQLSNRGAHSPAAAWAVESGVDFEKPIVANNQAFADFIRVRIANLNL